MAFSFGSTTTAPKPGGFSFAQPPSTGFGTTQPAPAPLFGSAPAAAFGSAPGGFGTAPSFGGFSFNTSPQPGPSTGFGFGFGQTAPAAAPHATTSQILNSIPGNTPYSALPEDVRREIDTIHELMKRHRHTMANVQSLAPALLVKSTAESDKAAGPPQDLPLPRQISDLESSLHMLSTSLESTLAEVSELRSYGEHNLKSTFQYAVYPMESLAARRGVQPSQITNTFSQLIIMLACDVDRVETIPSPYLWNTLQSIEGRVKSLEQTVHSLHLQFRDFNSSEDTVEPLVKVTTIIRALNTAFLQVATNLAQIHAEIDGIKYRIRRILQVTGHVSEDSDPFNLADIKEREEELKVMGQIRNAVAKAQVMTSAPQQPASLFGQPAFGASTAPSTGLFGAAQTPSTGLFGAPSTSPPSTSLFGAPAAPSTTGLFGAPTSTTTPSTNLFNPATQPAPAPLFGSNPAPAFNFQAPSSSTTTTKSKSKTRTGRSRR